MTLKVQVQGFLTFLLLHVSVCDGSTTTTTLTPTGSEEGNAGDLVSVNCTFPNGPGNLVVEFNGVESSFLDAKKGREKTTIVTAKSSTLEMQAVGFGPNSGQTGLVIHLKFNLTANHNGSWLRCKFDSTASADHSSQSKYLKLTVLFPPCCDASSPVFVIQNTTDPSLRLNCSDAVHSRGNPPVCLQWNVSPSDSKCIGNPQGSCSEFYSINPIGKECDDATIDCMAQNGLGFTKKVFNLIVQSVPEKPENCSSSFIDRNQGALFQWNKPEDDNGFVVKKYDIIVHVNDIISKAKSLEISTHQFEFADGKDNDIIKFAVSARNVLGEGLKCSSNLRIPYRKCIYPTLERKTDKSITIICGTVPGVSQTGPFRVYYSTNKLMKSTMGDNFPITIDMLVPNTTYDIVVNPWEFYYWSPSKANLGQENVKAKSTSEITLTFPSVEGTGLDKGTIVTYRVYFDGENPRDYEAAPGNIQTIKIEDLKPDTEYFIRIAAVNNFDKESTH